AWPETVFRQTRAASVVSVEGLMSAIGTKRTFRVALHMSAFDPKRTLAFLNAMLDQPALVEMPFMARR
ncbi:MAG: hypothetical protein WCD62_13690, partial [Pseudolabrys sp.]